MKRRSKTFRLASNDAGVKESNQWKGMSFITEDEEGGYIIDDRVKLL